jgi:hypothetical protein
MTVADAQRDLLEEDPSSRDLVRSVGDFDETHGLR